MKEVAVHRRTTVVLVGAAMVCAAWAMSVERPDRMPAMRSDGPEPRILPENAYVDAGTSVEVRATEGDRLWYRLGGASFQSAKSDRVVLAAEPDERSAEAALAIPTAMSWRHPLSGLPAAMVVTACESEGRGSPGPATMRTYLFADHGPLPVVSISTDDSGLYDGSTGITVPGNAIMDPDPHVLQSYLADIRWWKYPGNYHGRGKEWERPACMQLIGTDGKEILRSALDIRVNGQMTRGFPQHALRLLFRDPLRASAFGERDVPGAHSLVLRAAGNDQVKAMMRDAFQHGLCVGLPFETSLAQPCVFYLNGAYQGVYHIRQRMDANELARRYDLPKKRITLLEDNSVFDCGEEQDVRGFNDLVSGTERWNGLDTAWVDSLEARLDVDGFLTYMASQMILGNMDWPRHNVKYWRFNGTPRTSSHADGRWYFIMGDSDLSFGANASAQADMFLKVRNAQVPISRLFMALMRSTGMRERFVRIATGLLDGPLSSERCSAGIDRFVQLMDAEMDRHTARWRKPANKEAWRSEVGILRRFAAEREQEVRQQLKRFQAS